jgi:hypothetical protein
VLSRRHHECPLTSTFCALAILIGDEKHDVAFSLYQFKGTKTEGLIQMLNADSHVMAEYSERTSAVKWQRVVLATQNELIEKWLGEHYPVQVAVASRT